METNDKSALAKSRSWKNPQLKQAYLARAIGIEKLDADIARLVRQIETPPGLTSPSQMEMGRKGVCWTEQERAAIFTATVRLQSIYLTETKTTMTALTPRKKTGLLFRLMEAVVKRILPPHRQREVTGIMAIPAPDRAKYSEAFALPQKEEKPEATAPFAQLPIPAPIIESPKTVTWTPQEEHALLVHLSHLMRKQGWKQIPQADDRFGSLMFQDMIRDAQTRACRSTRQRNLSFARAALEDAGLMPKLEAMARLPHLPALPPAPLEIDELVNMAPPKTAVNGNGSHPPHDRAVGEPFIPAVAPAPAGPDKFAAFSDAELMQAAFGRALGLAGRVEALEKSLRKVEEDASTYAQLVSEENEAITKRAVELANRVTELEERITASSSGAGQDKLPVVAILGCRKDEFDLIVKKAPEHGLKLTFKHYEQQQAKVVPVFGCDYAIMMPGLSHAQNDHVQKVIPRGQYLFLSNFSVSRTIAQLQVWFQPEAALAH